MRRTALFAAVGSVLAVASLSQAAFTITAAPSTVAAPAGKLALDLFALNDADPADGVNLQGAKIVFTGTNGTRAFFSTFDDGNGGIGVDPWNFGANAQANTILDPGSSNLRIAARTFQQHAFTNVPGDTDSPVTAEQATNGLPSFAADYAVLSAAVSAPANVPPGARFARLVLNSAAPTFTITGTLGGETGTAQPVNFSFGSVVTDTVVITPQSLTVDVAPAGLEGFGNVGDAALAVPVTVVGSGPLTVGAVDPKIVDNISISGTGNNRTITGSGFTFADIGNYQISFTAGTQTQTFTLNVVPEPASLGLVGLAGLGLIRRRK